MSTFDDIHNINYSTSSTKFPDFPDGFRGSPFNNDDSKFYLGTINFKKLINDLNRVGSFEYKYQNYKSSKQKIPKENALDGMKPIPYKVNEYFEIENINRKKNELVLDGELNMKDGIVEDSIYGKSVFSFYLNPRQQSIKYTKNIYFRDTNEIAIKLISFSYTDYILLSKQTGTFPGYEGKELVIDKFKAGFSKYSNNIRALKWLYLHAPVFVYKDRNISHITRDLFVILKGFVTEWGVNTELVVLKILEGLNNKINNPDVFLSYLLELYGKNETILEHLFYKIDDKFGDPNFTKLIHFLYKTWASSSFINPNNPIFSKSNGPTNLPYKSKKALGFYFSNVDLDFNKASIDVELTIEAKYEYYMAYSPIQKMDILKQKETEEQQTINYKYHPFYPIGISKVEDSSLKFPTARIPAFYILANHDLQFWSNVITGVEYGVDILSTFSGVGNISKFRHLARVAKVASKLNKVKVLKYTNILSKIQLAVGTIEIASATVNIGIRLSGTDSKFALALQEYLTIIELLSLSGELTSAVKKKFRDRLKKQAKKALKEKRDIEVIYQLIDDKDNNILKTLETESIDEAKSKVNGLIDTLKKSADDVVDTVIDVEKKKSAHVAYRNKIKTEIKNLKEFKAKKVIDKDWYNLVKYSEIKDLDAFYKKMIKKTPELVKYNFAEFKIRIFKNGVEVEQIIEYAHSGKKQLEGFLPRITDKKFLENVGDIKNIQSRINDSEIKFIYNFIINHSQKGDYFIIEMKNIMTTCYSCKTEFISLKNTIGLNKIRFKMITPKDIEKLEDLKEYLNL